MTSLISYLLSRGAVAPRDNKYEINDVTITSQSYHVTILLTYRSVSTTAQHVAFLPRNGVIASRRQTLYGGSAGCPWTNAWVHTAGHFLYNKRQNFTQFFCWNFGIKFGISEWFQGTIRIYRIVRYWNFHPIYPKSDISYGTSMKFDHPDQKCVQYIRVLLYHSLIQ